MNTGSRHRQVGSRARARLSSQEEKRNRYEYLVVFGFSEQYRLANIVEDGRVRRALEGSSSLCIISRVKRSDTMLKSRYVLEMEVITRIFIREFNCSTFIKGIEVFKNSPDR